MAAECEVEAAQGTCGLPALGRCGRCGKAFCMTHQAPDLAMTPVLDLCSECSGSDADRSRQRFFESSRQELLESGKHFLRSGAAVEALAGSGRSPDRIYTVETMYDRQRLRRRWTSRRVLTDRFSGWVIGELLWEWVDDEIRGSPDPHREPALTAVVGGDQEFAAYIDWPLVRVAKDPEGDGYILQMGAGKCLAVNAAAEAVRTMVGS